MSTTRHPANVAHETLGDAMMRWLRELLRGLRATVEDAHKFEDTGELRLTPEERNAGARWTR